MSIGPPGDDDGDGGPYTYTVLPVFCVLDIIMFLSGGMVCSMGVDVDV